MKIEDKPLKRCTEWRGEHAAVFDHGVNFIDRLAQYEDTGLTPEQISAIRDQQEAEKNEPLTFKDLTYMDSEPVWIEFLPDACGAELKFWALVSVGDDDVYLCNSLGGVSAYEEVSAEIKAIYRRPPKEDTDAV